MTRTGTAATRIAPAVSNVVGFAVHGQKLLQFFSNRYWLRRRRSAAIAMTTLFRVVTMVASSGIFGKVQQPLSTGTVIVFARGFHWQTITKNIEYVSKDKLNIKTDPKTLKFEKPVSRPLCIMPTWLLSRRKHVEKYAKIYIDLGFDVANITCSPWQASWPIIGSQVIASDLLRFLSANEDQKPLVVHGFSVGAYIWGELLVQVESDMERYKPVMDRVASQVWDSPADIDELPVGLGYALFPNNKLIQNTITAYMNAHLSLFHNLATKHYLRATKAYHRPACRAPSLFLVSKTDRIGTEVRSRNAKETMESIGIKCNLKCWDNSPHVRHYNSHPEEYIATLYSHLADSGLLRTTSNSTKDLKDSQRENIAAVNVR